MGHAERRRAAAVLIAGPTASGKSALALRLAAHLGGRIINADSMQVYADLRILTARPTEAEIAEVPHALYGTVDGAEAYSVSRWLADAQDELARAREAGQLPIVVGGTGLYLKALTHGLSAIPPVPAEIRVATRTQFAGRSPEELHAALSRVDPMTAAGLRPTDPQRILRALEVHAATGESLAAFQRRRAPAPVDLSSTVAIALKIDRSALAERIARRTDAMFGSDGLAEVEHLGARELDPTLPIMRAIGVREAMRHLAGASTKADAAAETVLASRQYVKRQETFFRHQLAGFRPLEPAAAEAHILATVQS